MKRSQITAILIAVFAVVWILSGVIFSAAAPPEKSIADHKEENGEQLTAVRVRDIAPEPFSYDITITGRSNANMKVDLRAEAAGQIQKLHIDRGASVKKGDVLAEIEINERGARVAEAERLVKQRQSEFDAANTLAEQGFVSRIRLNEAQAQLEAARAQLKQNTTTLQKTKITAPFDGIIQDRHIALGDFVNNGDMIFTLVNLDPMRFTGYLSERQILDIKPDSKAAIELLNGEAIEADIIFIAAAADPDTRTYRIDFQAENADGALKDGFTARIKVTVSDKQAYKISPSILSLDERGRIGVKIVGAEDIVEFVPIMIISDQEDHMWIQGLNDTARIITVGQEFVTHGQKVAPSLSTDQGGLL